MQGIKIIGTGCYIPDKVVTNDDFAKIIDTTSDWIVSRTGIEERRFSYDKLNFRMSAIAAEEALKSAGVNAEEVDFIIFSSCSPDFFYPATSCLIQKCIGAKNAACIDINSACTGFINGLDMARAYIMANDYKKVLIVAGEYLSRILDFEDRGSCFLFGDGAGAVLVEPSDKPFYSVTGADGDIFKALYGKIQYHTTNPFVTAEEYTAEDEIKEFFETERKNEYLQMDGKAVYRFAVDAMSNSVKDVCKKAGCELSDLDLIVPHQANKRIIQASMKALGVDESKVYINIEKRANTSSVCIPTCLDELFKAGKIKEGMKICLVGFGAGLTYGAIIFDV